MPPVPFKQAVDWQKRSLAESRSRFQMRKRGAAGWYHPHAPSPSPGRQIDLMISLNTAFQQIVIGDKLKKWWQIDKSQTAPHNHAFSCPFPRCLSPKILIVHKSQTMPNISNFWQWFLWTKKISIFPIRRGKLAKKSPTPHSTVPCIALAGSGFTVRVGFPNGHKESAFSKGPQSNQHSKT